MDIIFNEGNKKGITMKLLITGASGLLGSDIVRHSEVEGVETVKVRLKEENGFISADMTTEEGVRKIDSLEWDALVHTAAWRDPNQCDKDKDAAFKVNAEATANLAKLAAVRKAKFLYISTDYVFPGTNPPYKETAEPCPVNIYGETKLAGENKTLNTSGSFIVLRIPALYGTSAGLEASPLLLTSLKALDSGKIWDMEDSIIKYPTYTGDVADAVLFLLKKDARGIFHFSGQDKATKYEITRIIAEATGRDYRNIRRMVAPSTEAKRPKDSHLDISKILSMGFDKPRSFKERLTELFKEGLLDY